MTFPHQEPEGPPETGELVMLEWSCPMCSRHCVSASTNPPQGPCAGVPWLDCLCLVINKRECGAGA